MNGRGIGGVLLLCLGMFAGSLVAGNLPLLFNVSPLVLKGLSSFGAGLMCSLAMSVLIPEGIEALIEGHDETVASTVGWTLVVGFLCMYIMDQVSHQVNAAYTSRTAERHCPLPLHESNRTAAVDENDEAEPTQSVDTADTNNSTRATILSLIIHCVADGIAMGAALATPSDSGLAAVVFLAMLLHKAPMILAFASFLMNKNWQRRRVREGVLAISATTPLATVIMWLILQSRSDDKEISTSWTGKLLLFSAGSFLYAAMVHILPETLHSLHRWYEHIIVALGMLLPIFLRHDHHGHSHDHELQ